MEKAVEVYGNVSICNCISKKVTKEFPINLEYYKIRNEICTNEEKPYGIGIIKTHEDDVESSIEKSEFSNIFKEEKDADNMLKLLIENKVTPMSLREILEDFILL